MHYACESFYDRPDGSSPRITSIAARNLKNGQTRSFSIHKFGELDGSLAHDISKHYEKLEKKMLHEFFKWIKEQKHCLWLHWNMRDEKYGFHAIEARYRVLGGKPFEIDDSAKYDLSRILIDIYGDSYIGNPRLECLMQKNGVNRPNFRTGAEEAALFKQAHYVALHQSTLAKVDTLADLCQLAYDNKLKIDASWWDVHGHSVTAFMAFINSHPYILFCMLLLSLAANMVQLLGQ